jgi:hypothetical protein
VDGLAPLGPNLHQDPAPAGKVNRPSAIWHAGPIATPARKDKRRWVSSSLFPHATDPNGISRRGAATRRKEWVFHQTSLRLCVSARDFSGSVV